MSTFVTEWDHCEGVLHDLDISFQIQTFSCYVFAIKHLQTADVPGRFASTRMASAVELFVKIAL